MIEELIVSTKLNVHRNIRVGTDFVKHYLHKDLKCLLPLVIVNNYKGIVKTCHR